MPDYFSNIHFNIILPLRMVNDHSLFCIATTDLTNCKNLDT